MEDGSERREADAAECCTWRIERCGLLPATPPAQPGLLLGVTFVAFYQGRAGTEDGRKCKEEPADGNAEISR